METIRSKVIRFWRKQADSQTIEPVAFSTDQICKEPGLDPSEESDVFDLLWALVSERLLKPIRYNYGYKGKGNGSKLFGAWIFALTAYGKQCLSQQEPTPYDPEGYLAWLRKLAQPLDRVIEGYIKESLEAFRYNLPFSSAVMLGCAAEQVFILVEKALVKWSAAHKEAYKVGPGARIKNRSNEMLKRLRELRESSSLPKDVAQHLDFDWCGIFNLIRTVRNDAGHPDLPVVDMSDAMAGLLTFPRFCQRALKLRRHLLKQAKKK